jgi:hypothetical protein
MSSWFQLLDDAATTAEVVGIARDYFAAWTPQEVARLPRACRPGKLRDESDLEEMHRNGVDAFRDTRASGDDLTCLQRQCGFLAHACVRIARIRGDGERSPADASAGAPAGPEASRDR